MNEWVRRSLSAGALTAGAVMATGAAAHADTTMISKDNTGILNGTQVYAPIQAPINLCGIAAAVAGHATAGCEGGSAASLKGLYDVDMISKDNTGILNGTQVFMPIQAPINVCGIAVGVLGDAAAWCEGGSSATIGDKKRHHKKGHYRTAGQESSPAAEVLGSVNGLPLVGNVAGLPRTLPASASGLTQNLPLSGLTQGLPLVGPLLNGLLGGPMRTVDVDALDQVESGRVAESGRVLESEGEGGRGGGKPCTGCPTTPRPVQPTPPAPPAKPCPSHGKGVKMITGDNVGILNGTQVYAPIQVPINVSGIGVGVLGHGHGWSDGGSSARM